MMLAIVERDLRKFMRQPLVLITYAIIQAAGEEGGERT
jgi:hypothetical protein